MGKKPAKKTTKKVMKEESEQEELIVEEPVVQKPKKTSKKESFQLKEVLSESFRDRLSQYIRLNEEVLNLKASVQGEDQSDKINERKTQMSSRVQDAAGYILKQELMSLQEWIGKQQQNLSDDIILLNKTYDENRKNLVNTGSFSSSQIDNLIAPIQSKQSERQKAYDSYGQLLQRSKDIYS